MDRMGQEAIEAVIIFITTARIRRMGKVIFSLCVSVHTSTGGGEGDYPILRSGWRRYPSQVWMVGGTPARSGWWGVPWPGQDGGGGVPQPGLDGGGYPSQVWMVGVPGYPWPGLDGCGGTWGTSSQVWMVGGYPSQVWMVGGTPARSGWWGGYPGQVMMVGVP